MGGGEFIGVCVGGRGLIKFEKGGKQYIGGGLYKIGGSNPLPAMGKDQLQISISIFVFNNAKNGIKVLNFT